MNTIDIRTEILGPVGRIKFAEGANQPADRGDIAAVLAVLPELHPDYLFIEVADNTSDYLAVRLTDVDNLIKALKKAQEIWGRK